MKTASCSAPRSTYFRGSFRPATYDASEDGDRDKRELGRLWKRQGYRLVLMPSREEGTTLR